MKIFKHEGHTAYQLWKSKSYKSLLFIVIKDKIQWIAKTKQGLKLVPNFRFSFKYPHIFIRLPLFYFEKNNRGIMFGTNNRYFWFIF